MNFFDKLEYFLKLTSLVGMVEMLTGEIMMYTENFITPRATMMRHLATGLIQLFLVTMSLLKRIALLNYTLKLHFLDGKSCCVPGIAPHCIELRADQCPDCKLGSVR